MQALLRVPKKHDALLRVPIPLPVYKIPQAYVQFISLIAIG